MSWLSGWLKELIILIMLASFAELLLPNTSVQRYARTVIGLFILLTLLSPVLALFQRGLDAGKLLAAADSWQLQTDSDGIAVSGAPPGMKPVDRVLSDGAKLRDANRNQAVKLVETQLAASIKEGIEQHEGTPVAAVQAVVKVDAKGDAVLDRIVVRLAKDGQSTGGPAGQNQTAAPIEPVEPVQIQLGAKGKAVPAQAAGDNAAIATDAAGKAIGKYVQTAWQLKPEQVTVLSGAAAR